MSDTILAYLLADNAIKKFSISSASLLEVVQSCLTIRAGCRSSVILDTFTDVNVVTEIIKSLQRGYRWAFDLFVISLSHTAFISSRVLWEFKLQPLENVYRIISSTSKDQLLQKNERAYKECIMMLESLLSVVYIDLGDKSPSVMRMSASFRPTPDSKGHQHTTNTKTGNGHKVVSSGASSVVECVPVSMSMSSCLTLIPPSLDACALHVWLLSTCQQIHSFLARPLQSATPESPHCLLALTPCEHHNLFSPHDRSIQLPVTGYLCEYPLLYTVAHRSPNLASIYDNPLSQLNQVKSQHELSEAERVKSESELPQRDYLKSESENLRQWVTQIFPENVTSRYAHVKKRHDNASTSLSMTGLSGRQVYGALRPCLVDINVNVDINVDVDGKVNNMDNNPEHRKNIGDYGHIVSSSSCSLCVNNSCVDCFVEDLYIQHYYLQTQLQIQTKPSTNNHTKVDTVVQDVREMSIKCGYDEDVSDWSNDDDDDDDNGDVDFDLDFDVSDLGKWRNDASSFIYCGNQRVYNKTKTHQEKVLRSTVYKIRQNNAPISQTNQPKKSGKKPNTKNQTVNSVSKSSTLYVDDIDETACLKRILDPSDFCLHWLLTVDRKTVNTIHNQDSHPSEKQCFVAQPPVVSEYAYKTRLLSCFTIPSKLTSIYKLKTIMNIHKSFINNRMKVMVMESMYLYLFMNETKRLSCSTKTNKFNSKGLTNQLWIVKADTFEYIPFNVTSGFVSL